jgi:hypothetical protein
MAKRTKDQQRDVLRRRFLRRRLFGHSLAWWKMWTLRSVCGFPLLLGVAWIILTHSPVTSRILLPRIGDSLGVDLSARRVVIGIRGNVVMEGVQARVPGIDHAAATFCQVERIDAEVDWGTIFTIGRPAIRQILLTDPLVRISQSMDDEALNVAPLRIVSSAGGPLDLPTITAEHAVIELGEHDQHNYTTLKRLFLAGELSPARGTIRKAFKVDLHESGPSVPYRRNTEGLRLTGNIDDAGADIEISGIDLDLLDPKSVPTPIREQFRNLDLKGDVTEARLNYSRQRGVVATMTLKDVDISPPLPPETGVDKPMRMHGTSGTISFSQNGLRADLSGSIEDLPYDVEIDYLGVKSDSAFTATLTTRGFDVSKNPELLPYAPHIVRKRFNNFSQPTAVVDAAVTVSRAEPTGEGPAPIKVDGRLEFVQGRASFEKFPYPFQDLVALVHFTDDKIVIDSVTGVAANGAKLNATAYIAPLTTHAYANVDVHVTGAPVDEILMDAMGTNRRKLVDAIMSRDHYQRLLDAGLISSEPGSDAPYFELGGVGEIDVNVQREGGSEDIWHTLVNVHFDRLGLMVEKFPYPIIGTDVTLVITDDCLTVEGGSFTGLEGGTAEVVASARFIRNPDGSETYIPDVLVKADGVPLGPLLAAALPDTPMGEDGTISPRRIVDALGMSGLASATVEVGARDDGEIGYDATATIESCVSTPHAASAFGVMQVRNITAAITSSEEGLRVEATGVMGPGDNAPGVHILVESVLGESTTSRIQATQVDASLPVECYVDIFSPKAAAELHELRNTMHPSGTLDVDVLGVVRANKPAVTTVSLANPCDLSFDLFDARIGLDNAVGNAVIDAVEDPRIEFTGMQADVTANGAPAGRVTIDGLVPLASLARRDAPDPLPEDLGALRLQASGARFESALSGWIVHRFLPLTIVELYDESKPVGAFGADLVLSTIVDDDGAYAFDPEGTFSPESLAYERRNVKVELDTEGEVTFGRRWGTYQDLDIVAPKWRATLAGSWNAGAQVISHDTNIDLDAESITDDLRTFLPLALVGKLDEIGLVAGGPISMHGARLSGERAATDEASELSFHADVDFEDVSLTPGIELTECDGSVAIATEIAPAISPLAYELAFSVDKLRVAGARLTNARALLLSGDQPRELLMPHFSARSHAGRASATAHVWPTSQSETGPLEYVIDIRLSGVRFSPLIADVAAAQMDGEDEMVDEAGTASLDSDVEALEPDEAVWTNTDDRSRGEIDAGITLGGIVGRHDTRRGSGVVEIFGGSILRLPALIVQLIELSNFQPPANERLDYARAAFFIDGEFIGFEDLSVFSRSVSILGTGSLDWATRNLDLKFHTRAARRIPMLSQIIEGIRDELATATVRGPIGDYDLRVEQFTGDSTLVENLFSARRGRIGERARQPEAPAIAPVSAAGDGE